MKKNSKKNIFKYTTKIVRKDRESLLNQVSFIIWFTGLSASGKSTIGSSVEYNLYNLGYLTFMLDGDNVRDGLNKDLGFSADDRKENIRRIAQVSKLLIDAGIIVIATFISPFKEDRKFVRDLVGTENFIEVFVECSLEICMERDIKGLYKKAINNEISEFTGISSPYEKPENPELIINTRKMTVDQSTEFIIQYLQNHKFIKIKK